MLCVVLVCETVMLNMAVMCKKIYILAYCCLSSYGFELFKRLIEIDGKIKILFSGMGQVLDSFCTFVLIPAFIFGSYKTGSTLWRMMTCTLFRI